MVGTEMTVNENGHGKDDLVLEVQEEDEPLVMEVLATGLDYRVEAVDGNGE